MSTRANIIIQDEYDKLYFYKHYDGYPSGVKEELDLFVKWLKDRRIRDVLSQSAGWLIIIGSIRYDSIPGYIKKDKGLPDIKEPNDWKVGAYEPTTGIHGDVEHVYVIDLVKKEWYEEDKSEVTK